MSRPVVICDFTNRSFLSHFPSVVWLDHRLTIIRTLGTRHSTNIPHRMGELEPWIDENFIRSVWFGMGESVNVKMIRDKFSGLVLITWSNYVSIIKLTHLS